MNEISQGPGRVPNSQSYYARLALWSSITGCAAACLSVFCIGGALGVMAVLLGYQARSGLKKSDETSQQLNRATNGIRAGWIGIVLALGVFALFQVEMRGRGKIGKERHCINNLRLIQSAKEQWALEFRKGSNDVPTTTELTPLLGLPRVEMMPTCPLGGVYEFKSVGEHATCSIPEHSISDALKQ